MKFRLTIFFSFCIKLIFAQLISPFNTRYSTSQKGGIRILSNVSVSCNSGGTCNSAIAEFPPNGSSSNGSFTMNYVDIDGNSSTFMSSSDSLNLANCSEILWAGLYWSGRATSAVTNWNIRNQVRIRVGTGVYQTLTADQLIDAQSLGTHPSYHCFKNITSIVQSAGIKARLTVANVVTQTGGSNYWGGWSIIVVYKNVFQSMRNLTVFDGFGNISSGSFLDIPIAGFATPPSGPVGFELGVIGFEGDRGSTGDQLQFNGAGTFVNVSDGLHQTNDFFNSTISYGGAVTNFRNPGMNNSLGYDASIFLPNNSTFNYIGNNATSATIRVTTSSENILARAFTSAIDIYEPDLRADVRIKDLNGGLVAPGDFLEYTLVGKNIGSDVSINTYMVDTLDPRTTYVPNSISITHGPNSGAKTDATNDDQAEYNSSNKTLKFRIGTGANNIFGGQVSASSSGSDSTVVKFRVQVIDDCLMFQCDSTLSHLAYIYGTGNISGNSYNNGGASDTYDAFGCPSQASNVLLIDVSGCPPPTINYNNPVCVGENLVLTTTFSAAANYSWTGPATFSGNNNTQTIINSSQANAGDYGVVISFPGLNCSLDTFLNVSIHSNPIINLDSLRNATCFAAGNGKIYTTVTSGTPSFQYQWSSGTSNTSNVFGLNAGNYTLIVTDINTCSDTATFTITQPTQLVATASKTSNYNGRDISCIGANNGSVAVAYNGGTPPYQINWSPGNQNSASLSGLGPGVYTATITDANGCVKTSNVTLANPPALTSNHTQINVSCFGGSNGSIDLTVGGGTPGYTYLWSNGQSTQDITGLTAGTYSVTITDLNGCTKNHSVAISQPNAALTLSSTQVNVLCFGNTTGSIDVSVSGGTPGYTYNWSNGFISQDINSLMAGNYTLIATDSKGCSAQLSVLVTQPASPLNSSMVETNIACFSDATGSINLNVFGGTVPYSYSWDNGSLTEDRIGLTSGQYIVTITDINGCILKDTANLSQPIAPLVAQITKVDATCFGSSDGSINLSINGGTIPYSFYWSSGTSTEDLTSLAAGNYQVQVTDMNGCSLSTNTTINQPPQIAVTSSNNDVLCFGESTGSISLSVFGGITPYQFSWSNGSTLQDLNNVSAGNYSVVITDANNCTQSFSTSIVEPLTAIDLSISHTDALCIGGQQGTTDLSVSGGTPPYSFLWNNNQISEDLSNLVAGYYYCSVTDNHGCSDTIGATIFDPSNTIDPSISKSNVSCFGGSDGAADLSIIGGLPPYEYSWNSGSVSQDLSNLQTGNYFVTITDANSCQSFISTFVDQPNAPLSSVESLTNVKCFGNSTGAIDVTINGGTPPYSYSWSNGLITEDLSEISAGVYQLIVTDFNNCQLTINAVISEPTDLILSALTEHVKCFGGSDGSIDLTVSGGVSPYSYSYSNGSVLQDLSNLLFGNYKVIVSDNNLCKDSLTILVSQPSSPLQVDELLSHVSCFSGNDGSIDITISGGTNPYSVSWNNGSSEQDQINLSSGNYTLDITDDNGCYLSESSTLNQPAAPLSTQMTMTENLCFGDSTGTASVLVFGGTPGYSYSWESGQTTSQITGLYSGIYIVEVKDSKNCFLRDTIEVSQPTKLSVNADSLGVSCWGGSDGGTISFAQGGVGSYSFNWLPINNNNQNVSNLTAGIYSIQVTDQNNCFATDSTEVVQPDSLFATFELTDILCHGEPTGAIDATLFGGTAPFSCFCINNLSGLDTAGLTAGFYQYVVVDDNGCSITSTLELTEPPAISALSQMIPVNCFGGNDGSLNINVTGGIDTYEFLWSIGDTTANIDSLFSGNYVLQVKDSNNCISSFTFSVTEPALPLTSSFVAVQPQCFGYSNGQLLITTSGGTPGYNYLWSTGDTTQNLDSLFTGNYSVIITDTNNCKDTLDCFLAEPAQLQPSFDADILVGCSPLVVNFSNTSNASYNCVWTFGNEGNFNGCEGVTYQFEAGGIFDVSLTVYDSNGCFNDITYQDFITVYQSPIASINANPTVLYPEQNTTFVSNNSLHGDFYIWNMGDGTSNELLFEPGTYTYPLNFADSFLITLYAMTTEGCSDTAYQKIFFRNDPYYYVPNTFTVNDDLMNDSWSPIFSNPYGVKKYLMQIFNRWGELIFETNDVFLGWNGAMNNEQVQDGTYSWRMQFTWVDNRVYSEVGHVNLLR